MNGVDARIMVVEDDPDDVLFLERAFERVGLAVPFSVVTDGEEAVRYLDRRAPYDGPAAPPLPDRVLLDLKLPRRSGIEVLRWMRAEARHRDRRVIVFTSSDLPADRAACAALGVDAYLVKPVGLLELEGSVRRIAAIWGLGKAGGSAA